MPRTARAILISCCLLGSGAASAQASVKVLPPAVSLRSPEASQQLLVSAPGSGDRSIDITRDVTYEIVDPDIITIDDRGLIEPLGEGQTEIVVRHGADAVRLPVEVRGIVRPPVISFQHEIIPILTKARCNSGGCHGKAEGQNGFKLSVFGFDPAADYDTIVKASRWRRISFASPEQSLFLQKASNTVPHGGGKKIPKTSLWYDRLERWISEGCRYEGEAAEVTAIAVVPEQQVLDAGQSQQLQVTAIDAAGRRRCVTVEAEFESNAEMIAHVDARGLIQSSALPGEATILVRYMGQVAVCRVTQPRSGVKFERPGENNFVDSLVWNKLERLGIAPSPPADDATFLRRAYLDTIGTLPTATDARAFLTSDKNNSREEVVDALLTRDEYADYWTMRWADILLIDRDKMTAPGAVAMSRWLHRQFAENRPYDEMVRELLTAKGDTLAEGPAAFYKVLKTPEELGRSVSQLFLGVRIECAQCHHHPYEKWSQSDYFGLAGFFTGVSRKNLPTGSESILARGGADLKHPRTEQPVPTRALGAVAEDLGSVDDRRAVLADWVTGPENPYFARAAVNRLWAHYFGRGLIEPIDDLRQTNPATNQPLLAALAEHFRVLGYDQKAFTRTLLNSNAYQLASITTQDNIGDEQNFSHARYKALPAEVLLDAIGQATEVPEKFNGWPRGYRAIQIWDNRMPSYFFEIFGRPVRATVCQCERGNEPSIAQALHLINSPEILGKIESSSGRVTRLVESRTSPKTIVEELCLSTLSRFPTPAEEQLLLKEFTRSGVSTAAEDIMWTLMNSKEFLHNH